MKGTPAALIAAKKRTEKTLLPVLLPVDRPLETKSPPANAGGLLIGVPTGIRTPVSTDTTLHQRLTLH
jgi:hypothetical protein